MNEVLFALVLTLFAGLSTGIGSAIAFFAKHTNTRFLSFSLGLSAGVMIYISFMELLSTSRTDLVALYGSGSGNLFAIAAFFGGMALAAGIDRLVPSAENPHELHSIEEMDGKSKHHKHMHRVGIITAISIAVHNFPEGIATFMAGVGSPQIGIAIAVAIAIHNIPEGIAVSVPVYYATKSRKKAFWYSFLSGLSEPVGALVAWLILMPFLSPALMAVIFAAVAGIMVFISLDELLPAAHQYGENHSAIAGIVTGMAVMAVSLVLLT